MFISHYIAKKHKLNKSKTKAKINKKTDTKKREKPNKTEWKTNRNDVTLRNDEILCQNRIFSNVPRRR